MVKFLRKKVLVRQLIRNFSMFYENQTCITFIFTFCSPYFKILLLTINHYFKYHIRQG